MEGPLEGERHVAETAAPLARGVLERADRRHQFDLIPRPQPPLVDQLALDRSLLAAGHGHRPDRFVLGEGLLGEERARQVQVALRPRRIGAERADVGDGEADVVGRQRVAERRHVPIEGAHRAALVNDGEPVGVRFAGRKGAVA